MKYQTLTAGLIAASLMALGGNAHAQGLPDTMTWTAYDVGSQGHSEASAIADAFGRAHNSRIRIQPAGSAIGRLQPLVAGRADYAYLATESFFASEGIHDFAERRWGPQDLRAVAGRPSTFGVPSAADADIHTLEDLRGKRVAYVAGNPSVNVKCDAILAFGGLTRDDVDAVMFPTHGAAMSSMVQNQADAACTTTTASQLYELEESSRGIRWVDIPADDEQGWQRMNRVAPVFQPFQETIGAGLSETSPANMLAYRYPIIVALGNKSDDEVYEFVKALDETYDLYKDATSAIHRWRIEDAGAPPIDIPFHAGAIRYLEEQGIWDEEMQAWNHARLARLEALSDAWSQVREEGDGLDEEAFAARWNERREQVLSELP
ncbi:TAXI family TRAP transporter solute-binding subunit [Halomonas urumqiensis]|uniref:C4-dicarboxylate ABC transporter substrate-binding protein n=1 Tax=Halomonas urumqiensis TaxID=1684789 RepID=A0A2N7ULU3_9GAMM|nr:TAXI family TRAP transporter solute-binding subunit [Halomonas urumqiensis]PMR81407.1 C4-dicarboxylate ABC transporter substrate-binding protein [Halomonas urumqiensis]PTB01207.1 C4-dicarboxylate ABC transporter substrate-binding protein [Halomonas urumqiensis]GHE22784.1 C4-dicarboxylate ABC transporter [Halomonas urumqiensis]